VILSLLKQGEHQLVNRWRLPVDVEFVAFQDANGATWARAWNGVLLSAKASMLLNSHSTREDMISQAGKITSGGCI
jgi:hypothetical protein